MRGLPRYVPHPGGQAVQKRGRRYRLGDQLTAARRREVEQGGLFLA